MSLANDVSFDRKRAVLWLCLLALLVGTLLVVWQYVGTLVLGLFAYYVARPVFDRIEARLPSRTLAVAVTLLVVVVPVLALVGWTLTVAVQQAVAALGPDVTAQFGTLVEPYVGASVTLDDIESTARTVVENPSQFDRLNRPAVAVLQTLLDSVLSLLTALIHLFIVLVVVFYLLRDDYRVASWARETFLTPDGVVDSYLRAVDSDLQTVFFGNILNAFLTGILGVVTYSALNLVAPPTVRIPNAVLLGLLSGVASLIPVIGIKLVWVPVGAYLLGNALLFDPATVWFVAVFAGVSVVVVDAIPDQLLRPYVSGRTLHVGAVMLAYTIGPLLFGWYGIFLGPLLLVVAVEFARHVIPWLVDPTDTPPSTQPEPTFATGDGANPTGATPPVAATELAEDTGEPAGEDVDTDETTGEPAAEDQSEETPADDRDGDTES